MADLFSILAQEQSSSDLIRPRVHTHFEESSFSPAAEFEEQILTRLPETADQANSTAEQRETEEPEARPAGPEMPGTSTIRETTVTPSDHVHADESKVANTAEPAQGSVPAPARKDFPAGEGRASEQAAVVQTPSFTPRESAEFAAGAMETIKAAETIKVDRTAAAPHPSPVEDEVETIRPARNDRQSLDVTYRDSDQDNAAPEVVEMSPSPVIPAATTDALTAPESAARPAEQAPNIEIHIGRIELRQAATQMQQAPAARPRFEPPVSLSAYLERRSGGGK
ncbi:MAG: hypothetical protein ACK2UO_00625 [Caldilineaceae bacterium]|jgi:hypothetical protein